MSKMNTIALYVSVFVIGVVVNLPWISSESPKSETKLIDLDTQTRAQVYSPNAPPTLSPLLANFLPPSFQNLLPKSKKNTPNVPLPLIFSPQLVNLLSKDIFSMAGHLLNIFNSVLPLPTGMTLPDQIATMQKLINEGQVRKEYMPYAEAFVSLLRDQPVLRALQESVSELQKSTSFNLSTSGQGINDIKFSSQFNLPATMITPSIQSSFGVASNPDTAADPTQRANKDEDPWIYE